MKKILIIQIILCLLSFLNNWFSDIIINRLTFIATIIINISLTILFIIVYSKVYIIQKNKNTIYKLINIVIMITTIFLSFYDFRLTKTKIELILFDNERNIIINKIKNNELSSYYKGNIKLPLYNYISSDGEIYVYQNNDEQVIGFWIFRGVLSDSVELIYSTGGRKLIEKYKKNHHYVNIKRLKKNWYYIIESN